MPPVALDETLRVGRRPMVPRLPKPASPEDEAALSVLQRRSAAVPNESPFASALRALDNAGLHSEAEVNARMAPPTIEFTPLDQSPNYDIRRGIRVDDYMPPESPSPSYLADQETLRAAGGPAPYGRYLTPAEETALGYRSPALDPIIDFLAEKDAQAGRILGTPLHPVTSHIPLGNYVQGFADEALRPTSLAAMLIPEVRGATLGETFLKNAALQGSANVGQDLLLGRTDPKELGLSFGAGALLGGITAPGVARGSFDAGAARFGEIADSPRVRRLLTEETGGGTPFDPFGRAGDDVTASVPGTEAVIPPAVAPDALAPQTTALEAAALPAPKPLTAAEKLAARRARNFGVARIKISTPEEIAVLTDRIERGAWTENPKARIGAKAVLNKMQRGEVTTDAERTLIMRALDSTPEAPAPKPTRKPRTKAAAEGGAPPPKPPVAAVPATPDPFDLSAEAAAMRELPGRGDQPRMMDELEGARAPQVEASPEHAITGENAYQRSLDLGPVRLADGMRRETLLDIADSPNAEGRFAAFMQAVIGAPGVAGRTAKATPHFVLNNKKDLALAPIQMFRTLKTAIDIGWGGRNGWRLFPMHKAAWARMYGRQYKTLVSEEAYQALQAQTMALPHATRLKEAGLAFLERGTGDLETTSESAMSKFTQNIPVLRQSERAYIAPGNAMRYEIANDVLTQWEKRNGVPMPDKLVKELVDHYNAATLRGNTRYLNKVHAEALGSILFSTKGLVSGPQFVAGGLKALADPKLDAALKREIAGDVAGYIAAGLGTMGLIGTTGYMLGGKDGPEFMSADINRLSPTFGQVKVGPVRWNYWGSDQSMVRQILVQMPIIGGEKEVGGIPEDVDRTNSIVQYFGGKLAPGAPKLAWDEVANRGRTFEGDNLHTRGGFAKALGRQAVPIPAETGTEAYQQAGPIAMVAALLADLNGASTSTYDDPEATAGERAKYEKTKDLGYNADDALKEYRAIGRDVWKELQAEGSAPTGYDSFGEFKTETIADVLSEIRDEEPDLGIVDAQAIAERMFTRMYGETEGLYTRLTTRARDAARRDPKVAEALVATGEGTATERQKELAKNP